jgi:hypothetical protein
MQKTESVANGFKQNTWTWFPVKVTGENVLYNKYREPLNPYHYS